jgi:uncharacterized metal-binding protein YceD (DUF177 family)
MPLKVNIRHVENDEVELRGELPAGELDLDCADDLVHVRQPVHYELTAQKTGRDVLVQGKVWLTLDCECARCLKAFQQPLELPHWTALALLSGPEKVEIKDDSVDLTPFLREDIPIALDCPIRRGKAPDKQKAPVPRRGRLSGRN